jgi:methylmalonyl-CoA mutase
LEILVVDNKKVMEEQVERINRTKNSRYAERDKMTLRALKSCAEKGKGNLLNFAIEAAKAKATLGEISMAMEEVAGRHTATIRSITGIYSKEVMKDAQFIKAQKLADDFEGKEGRRPRILIAKMGQDGHDRGAKVIATSFADMGFDVDIGPLFQTPKEVARQAMENDVHLVGVSSLAGSHKTLIPDLIDALDKLGRSDINIVAGGVIPPQDHEFLMDQGVIAVFGPGTAISDAAINILEKLMINHK